MNRQPELTIFNDCQGCGVCCMHMGYPAFIQPTDELQGEPRWYQLRNDLKQQLLDYIENYEIPEGQLDGPCIWLDPQTRECRHHEYRPQVCRDFEIGSRGCLEWRRHYRDRIID